MNIASELKMCSVWHYNVIAEDLYRVELGDYHTYSIQITTPEHTDILHDVSVCKKTAERIVDLLNFYHVSPIHLYDIVSDIL